MLMGPNKAEKAGLGDIRAYYRGVAHSANCHGLFFVDHKPSALIFFFTFFP